MLLIVIVKAVSELIGIELGNVTLIVVGVTNPHTILAFIKGAVIPHNDETLGII